MRLPHLDDRPGKAVALALTLALGVPTALVVRACQAGRPAALVGEACGADEACERAAREHLDDCVEDSTVTEGSGRYRTRRLDEARLLDCLTARSGRPMRVFR